MQRQYADSARLAALAAGHRFAGVLSGPTAQTWLAADRLRPGSWHPLVTAAAYRNLSTSVVVSVASAVQMARLGNLTSCWFARPMRSATSARTRVSRSVAWAASRSRSMTSSSTSPLASARQQRATIGLNSGWSSSNQAMGTVILPSRRSWKVALPSRFADPTISSRSSTS